MYGLLSFRANTAQMVFTLPYYSHLSTPLSVIQNSLATAKTGCLEALKWVEGVGPNTSHLFQDICTLHTGLMPHDREFAVRALAIHYRLPMDQQAQRVQRFSNAWDAYSMIPIDAPEWRQQKAMAMAVAKTYPTELIEPWTRIGCRWLTQHAAPTLHQRTRIPLLPSLATLNRLPEQHKLTSQQCAMLADLVLSRSSTERLGVAQTLTELSPDMLRNCLDAMAATRYHPLWVDLGDYLLQVQLPDAWARALNDTRQQGTDVFGEALAHHCNQTVNGFLADIDRLLRNTMEAVRSGTHMGERWNTGCRQALAAWQDHVRQHTSNWTAALRRTGYGGSASSTSDRQAAQREALQAWGIDQLVRWIDGPVTAPRTRAAVTKVKRQTAPEVRTPEPKSPATEPQTNASDMPHLLPVALSDSAQFLLGELRDLSAVARQLQQEDAIDPWLTEAPSALQAIAEASPSGPREPEAEQALLTRVDETLSGLRTRLAQVKSQVQLNARFDAALAQALQSEALVLGKRQGGVIGCALPVAQWASVHGRYHQRLLPMRRTVSVGDGLLPLGPDEALALYVTGSSQSGYAFDISVHLWTRRVGRASQPSLEQGAYPHMNTEDWFDTFQPCCVLHVPLAK